ncbi:hypothetical protein O181_046418 [Austropuccinia psidii MF-1]|uniref:Reverse transcriptase Ty1/copia-type domain-containing protein n=1 Tax=Austropuccinia psidii MF-1 TaxID=1389203 RepID=A0A9Q3DS91_9BASI|nr:hypothetical protein [Austropuccinia psidii MF-1]
MSLLPWRQEEVCPPALWLYVHVDDIAIFGKEVETFKKENSSEFDIKDLGKADLMLGIKVTQTNNRVTLDQQCFAQALLDLYGMDKELSAFSALSVNYRSAVESVNYLSTATQADLSHAVFLHLLHYLKGSQDFALTYEASNEHGIAAYSNADWGDCTDMQWLVTSYRVQFNKCPVICKMRKQPTVSLSTWEAEYKSLCSVTSKLLWLQKWCRESQLSSSVSPTPVNEDNQGRVATATLMVEE